MGTVFEGRFEAQGRKLALVASRFNEFFTRELVAGAQDCLRRHGVADGDVGLLGGVEGDLDLTGGKGHLKDGLAGRRAGTERRSDRVDLDGARLEQHRPQGELAGHRHVVRRLESFDRPLGGGREAVAAEVLAVAEGVQVRIEGSHVGPW